MSELGELLTTAREKREWTIADVADDTKIRPQYLQALEAGEYETLPGEVCTVGFLRNYAQALGLDPQEILNLYRNEAPRREAVRQMQSIEVPLIPSTPVPLSLVIVMIIVLLGAIAFAIAYNRYGFSPIALIPTSRPAATRTATPRPSPTVTPSRGAARGTPTRFQTATAVPTKLISVASATVDRSLPATPTATSLPVKPTRTVRPSPTRTVKQTTTSVPSPTFSPTKTYTSTPTRSPTPHATATVTAKSEVTPTFITQQSLKVRLDVVERAWVRVVIDGEQVLEEILEKGAYRLWTVSREIAVRSGNAGGVIVSLNDQEYGPMGERGQVVDMIWTKNADGVWSQTTPVASE